MLLFGLFWAQFVIGAAVPESHGGIELIVLGVVYLVLGAMVFARERERVLPLARDGLRTPYRALRSGSGGG